MHCLQVLLLALHKVRVRILNYLVAIDRTDKRLESKIDGLHLDVGLALVAALVKAQCAWHIDLLIKNRVKCQIEANYC